MIKTAKTVAIRSVLRRLTASNGLRNSTSLEILNCSFVLILIHNTVSLGFKLFKAAMAPGNF